MSTLVGIAIAEGKISGVDATLEDLLPEYRKDMDDRTRKTTLHQLLTMTAGWTDGDPQPTGIYCGPGFVRAPNYSRASSSGTPT